MKIDALPLDMQIAAAVARKVQTVQKIEGQAAVDLITAAGDVAPPPGADGRGARINTKA